MFLLKTCSSSHSCCLNLAGLTNAGLVFSPERVLSLGSLGTCTNTVLGSCFSFTFNTDRGKNRGQESGVVEKKTGKRTKMEHEDEKRGQQREIKNK